MAHRRDTSKYAAIVPHQSTAGNEIHVHFGHVVPERGVVNALALHLFDTNARHKTDGKREAWHNDPVVGVARAEAVVAVVDTRHTHLLQQAWRIHFFVGRQQKGGQLIVVDIPLLCIKSEAEYPRATTLQLHSALGEGGGIGEFSMIEHVVNVEAQRLGRKPRKVLRTKCFIVLAKSANTIEVEVVLVANIHQVAAQHRTIKTEAQFSGTAHLRTFTKVKGIA